MPLPQLGLDTAPSYYLNGYPGKMRAAYVRQWETEHAVTPGHEPLMDGVVYKSDDSDDVRPHLSNFSRLVKSRKPAPEDVVFGNHAAIACHMANEPYFRGKPMKWDEGAREITGS